MSNFDYLYSLINHYRTELNKIEKSRSWRLTKFLREFKRLFVKLNLSNIKASSHVNVSNKISQGVPLSTNFILITHELSKTGAPFVALELIKSLKLERNQIFVISRLDGPLRTSFEEFSNLIIFDPNVDNFLDFLSFENNISTFKNATVLLNTLTLSDYAKDLNFHSISYSSWAHELQSSWSIIGLEKIKYQIQFSQSIICDSLELKNQIQNNFPEHKNIFFVENGFSGIISSSACDVRKNIGVTANDFLIVIPATRQVRKGFDLLPHFVEELYFQSPSLNIKVLWIGDVQSLELEVFVRSEIESSPFAEHILFFPNSPYYLDILNASDIVLFLSREDSAPQVLLGAEKLGKATFLLSKVSEKLNYSNCSRHLRIHNLVLNIISYLTSEPRYSSKEPGEINTWNEVSADILKILKDDQHNTSIKEDRSNKINSSEKKKEILPVTAIIVFYNQANFVNLRLENIFQQSKLPQEILIIDDNSDDDTRLNIVNFIEQNSIANEINISLLFNDTNFGISTLSWKKGIERSSHDVVWIAEGDDLNDRFFLERTFTEMKELGSSIVGCQNIVFTSTADLANKLRNPDYKSPEFYVFPLNFHRLSSRKKLDFIDIKRNLLSTGNAFYNVGALLWEKDTLSQALKGSSHELRLFCDYEVYLNVPSSASFTLLPMLGNYFKNHQSTVRSTTSVNEFSNQARKIFLDYIVDDTDVTNQSKLQYIINILRTVSSDPTSDYWISEIVKLRERCNYEIIIYFHEFKDAYDESDSSTDFFLESLSLNFIVLNILSPDMFNPEVLDKLIAIIEPRLFLKDWKQTNLDIKYYNKITSLALINKKLKLEGFAALDPMDDLVFFGSQEDLYEKCWPNRRILFIPNQIHFENKLILKQNILEFIYGSIGKE